MLYGYLNIFIIKSVNLLNVDLRGHFCIFSNKSNSLYGKLSLLRSCFLME